MRHLLLTTLVVMMMGFGYWGITITQAVGNLAVSVKQLQQQVHVLYSKEEANAGTSEPQREAKVQH